MGLTALLMYGATYTGLYLTSTPYQLPEINGVQTRYLLAAFFALLVLAAMLYKPLKKYILGQDLAK